MKLNPEGVEKAAAVFDAAPGVYAKDSNALATAVITAYFDHLKEAGLMRESVAYRSGDTWDANTNYAGTGGKHDDFPCFIIRTDKD